MHICFVYCLLCGRNTSECNRIVAVWNNVELGPKRYWACESFLKYFNCFLSFVGTLKWNGKLKEKHIGNSVNQQWLTCVPECLNKITAVIVGSICCSMWKASSRYNCKLPSPFSQIILNHKNPFSEQNSQTQKKKTKKLSSQKCQSHLRKRRWNPFLSNGRGLSGVWYVSVLKCF